VAIVFGAIASSVTLDRDELGRQSRREGGSKNFFLRRGVLAALNAKAVTRRLPNCVNAPSAGASLNQRTGRSRPQTRAANGHRSGEGLAVRTPHSRAGKRDRLRRSASGID
jgi:hypothetical protein